MKGIGCENLNENCIMGPKKEIPHKRTHTTRSLVGLFSFVE